LENAADWGVLDSVLGVQVGFPKTKFGANSFDYVYSTTTLEMIRGFEGTSAYTKALAEIYRVLRPGGRFGLGEPMHLDVDIPSDLIPLVTAGDASWADCFATLGETAMACRSVGFEILEADYAPDARLWWEEYTAYDPYCQNEPDGDRRTLEIDNGRWVSYGYVVGLKPLTS
jgi:SAM-dependent methyltransferase